MSEPRWLSLICVAIIKLLPLLLQYNVISSLYFMYTFLSFEKKLITNLRLSVCPHNALKKFTSLSQGSGLVQNTAKITRLDDWLEMVERPETFELWDWLRDSPSSLDQSPATPSLAPPWKLVAGLSFVRNVRFGEAWKLKYVSTIIQL